MRGGARKSSKKITRKVRYLMREYAGGGVENDALPQWELPPWPWIKINVDVVVRPEFALDVGIARNDQGDVLVVCAKRCDCPHPLVAETRAILFAAKASY